MSRGLALFIGARSKDEFLINNWPGRPFVAHNSFDSLDELLKLPFLASLESLLQFWKGPVQAHLPDRSDEVSSVDVTCEDARKLFSCGMPLLFNNAEKREPRLQEWIKSIHSDLGMPSMTYGRSMIYATPDGKGTAPHFDQNVNFVLQVRGTKTWWLAENQHVVNPLERHTIGMPMDPTLESYVDEPMPIAMPEDRIKIVLEPGSVLFVPRGYWHMTEAKGEALALNFTFNQPTWIDLFTTALKSRLALSPDWRALADGVSSDDPDRRAIACQNFDSLLMELVADLPNWQARDILGATEGA